MPLAKETVVDKIEVLEDGTIQVRRAMYVTDNGVRITEPQYHRAVFQPGQSVEIAKDGGSRAVAVANLIWTPAVVSAFQAKQAKP